MTCITKEKELISKQFKIRFQGSQGTAGNSIVHKIFIERVDQIREQIWRMRKYFREVPPHQC